MSCVGVPGHLQVDIFVVILTDKLAARRRPHAVDRTVADASERRFEGLAFRAATGGDRHHERGTARACKRTILEPVWWSFPAATVAAGGLQSLRRLFRRPAAAESSAAGRLLARPAATT